MRILVLSNLFPPHVLGGYEILCGQVCAELQRLGHTVEILTSDHGVTTGAEKGETNREMQNVRRDLKLYLPFDRPASRSRRQRAIVGNANDRITREAIARFLPDVIFVWSLLRLTVAPARAAQESGVPVAYTFNDQNIHSYQAAHFGLSPRSLVAWAADRMLAQTTLHGLRFPHSTCISQRLKTNLLARKIPVERAQVIYQGIPIARFPLKPLPGAIGRPARLLYAGQLHAYKGVHTLIEAAQLLAAQGLDFTVSLVGEGTPEYRNELMQSAAAGKAQIEFCGKRAHAEMPALYREHDIFVFPSIWPEPFGLTHLEAMASGTPVVSTANGGQGEFLCDGENALVFREESAAALADCIARLMREPELARRIACGGRQAVEAQFTLAGYVKRLETFLLQVVRDESGEKSQ
jgi:glycosyltransferase involved in cell wall biosynthesis